MRILIGGQACLSIKKERIMKMIQWVTDQFAENVAKNLGVKLTVETIKLADIDWSSSLDNHARLTNLLDQEIVMNYGIAMESGDQFPMIVVIRRKKTKPPLVIAGGNHRANAAKEVGVSEIRAYVAETEDFYISDMLPRRLNPASQGMKTEDLLQHAIYEHVTYGTQIKDVADAFHVSSNVLATKLRARKMREDLAKMGVDSQLIPDTTLDALRMISSNEKVLNSTAKLIVASHLKGSSVNDLIKSIRENKSEATQLACIEEKEKELHVINGKVPAVRRAGIQRATKFRRWISEGMSFNDKSIAKIGITEKEEAAAICKKLVQISAIAERLAKTASRVS